MASRGRGDRIDRWTERYERIERVQASRKRGNEQAKRDAVKRIVKGKDHYGRDVPRKKGER